MREDVYSRLARRQQRLVELEDKYRERPLVTLGRQFSGSFLVSVVANIFMFPVSEPHPLTFALGLLVGVGAARVVDAIRITILNFQIEKGKTEILLGGNLVN